VRQTARIEMLGDALDRAALARRIATLEDHQHLELLVHHPVLQPHQFVLQPEQLAEVKPALKRRASGRGKTLGHQLIELVVLDLQLQFLVEAVADLLPDPVEFSGIAVQFQPSHGRSPALRRAATTRLLRLCDGLSTFGQKPEIREFPEQLLRPGRGIDDEQLHRPRAGVERRVESALRDEHGAAGADLLHFRRAVGPLDHLLAVA
jgi:hypothetical protein